MKYNVINGKTLKQYNEKYKNRRHVLMSFTKDELKAYTKSHNSKELYLLGKKTWWLIDNTYYEVPKPIRLVWFRNLSKKAQAATYVVLAGLLASLVVSTCHIVKLTKMVTEDEWINAINYVTDMTGDRNFTFTGEFDNKLGSNNVDPGRIKEKVYVVNNEEHVIRNIIKPNKTETSEACYKIVSSNEFIVKYKNDGVWSKYEQTAMYTLPSYELQELPIFKHLYNESKFNGDAYTYFVPASEGQPSVTYKLRFKYKKLVGFYIEHFDRKDYRKFEFSNYGKTSINI